MKLDTHLVRRLGSSHFNYWFGYVANMTWVVWLAAQARPQGPAPLGLAAFSAYFIFGIFLWTLLEYVLHRFVYHVIPSFLSQGHQLHHDAPRELIGVPWWLTSVALWAIFIGLSRYFHAGATGAVMGGVWLGYIGYCLLHHGTHHWAMGNRYLRQVKKMHHLHHVYPDVNWGFSSPLWDMAFGTYLSVSAARVRAKKNPRSAPNPRSSETAAQGS